MYSKYFTEVHKILRPCYPEWTTGAQLRQELNKGKWWWERWSGPQFYYLMTEMEDTGLVVGHTFSREIDGITVGRRAYRLPGGEQCDL